VPVLWVFYVPVKGPIGAINMSTDIFDFRSRPFGLS
jgi:hypothetical protein